MVFKSLNNLAPHYLCNPFTRMSQLLSMNLRTITTDLKLPRKNSKSGQKCFSFRGAKLWNELPVESKQATSLSSFKELLNKKVFYTFLLCMHISIINKLRLLAVSYITFLYIVNLPTYFLQWRFP